MKKLKLNAMALAALVVAAGTVAFKAPASQEWVFIGDESSEIKMASAYSLEASKPTGCNDTSPLPCSITVNAEDQQALQTYLDSRSTSQILSQANGRRN